ncbi:MAG: amidohydrolase [Candidatus Eisenbacteria bacterium]
MTDRPDHAEPDDDPGHVDHSDDVHHRDEAERADHHARSARSARPVSRSAGDLQVELRHELHRHPDLSNHEQETAARVRRFVESFTPDRIVDGIGGAGLAVVYEGSASGPCVVIRSELDALPIQESGTRGHRSMREGIAHSCGHDGHMAIVAGLAPRLQERRPARGRVVLLFQPAEETGEGAGRVLGSEPLRSLAPDRVYAFHNLPGFPMGAVVVRDGVFAYGSRGMIIRLRGVTSHAAEPERGVSPARAVSELIPAIAEIGSHPDAYATVVHVRVGERAFGVSPGYGEVLATLRASEAGRLRELSEDCVRLAQRIAGDHGLSTELDWVDEFPVTHNAAGCVEIVRAAAVGLAVPVITPPEPFRWSEDFGHYTDAYEAALFGLGSGPDQPTLHRPEFDFPDDLLATGTRILEQIVRLELG